MNQVFWDVKEKFILTVNVKNQQGFPRWSLSLFNKEGDKAQVLLRSKDYKEVERKRKAMEQSSKKEHDLKKFKEKEMISSCYLKQTYDEFLEKFNDEEWCSNSELECSYYTEISHVLDKSEDLN